MMNDTGSTGDIGHLIGLDSTIHTVLAGSPLKLTSEQWLAGVGREPQVQVLSDGPLAFK